MLETHVGRGASIGGGAAILPGLRIGARAMVGAGSVVTHDVPARAIVSGNPARIVGYVDATRRPETAPTSFKSRAGGEVMDDVGARRHRASPAARRTTFAGASQPASSWRRFHSRRNAISSSSTCRARTSAASTRIAQCHQFLVCVRGSLAVVVDDGTTSEEFALDGPNLGLYLPPMVWAVQYQYSADAMLLVFASEHYDADDYIRDYDEFLAARSSP